MIRGKRFSCLRGHFFFFFFFFKKKITYAFAANQVTPANSQK